MSLELLVACGDTPFRFDTGGLRASAANRWAATSYVDAGPSWAHIAEGEINVPGDDGVTDTEITLHRGGDGVGLDARTVEAAADVLAWLATAPGLPDDGSVVVIHWQNEVYPLRPGISTEELIADYQL